MRKEDADGFFRQYKGEWMESFSKHLELHDSKKLENALQLLMKQLAATLLKQRRVQYDFGPEYNEYMARKQQGCFERHI